MDKESEETKARRKANAEFAKKRFRGISNADFAKTDQAFKTACEKTNTQPTSRQASKWRQKTGKAYNGRNK